MITYKKMSLFDAPQGSLIVHACNARGVWGGGIAAEFKKRYPSSFEKYSDFCMYYDYPVGNGWIFPDIPHRIGCLITSDGYGAKADPPYRILKNTKYALEMFLSKMYGCGVVYSNKFNSGLFNVPWPETEKVLEEAIGKQEIEWIEWIVCSQE